MADRHRLGTFDKNGRFSVTLDLADQSGNYAPVRDTFKVTPPAQTEVVVKNWRRYGGNRRVAEIHDNGQVAVSLYIQGVSQNDALVKREALLAILEDSRTQYFYEHRPENSTYSTYYEIRGTAWEPPYSWVSFSQTAMLQVDVTANTAPLGLGDKLDIFDDFSIDTITAGDYTFDAGAGTVAVANGVLTVSSTALKSMIHTARGYSYPDAQVALKYTTGATVAGSGVGVFVKRLDANNSIYVRTSGASGNQLSIIKNDGGVLTTLASSGAFAVAPVANTPYWIEPRIEGNVVTAEHWTTPPTPSGTPAATVSYTLTGADATKFGAGVVGQAGMRLTPLDTAWTFDDFRVEPYTYRGRSLPDTVDLLDIPGSAPAKVDVSVGVNNPGVQLVWTVIGWITKPTVENRVWNGDFEDPALVSAGTPTGWTFTVDDFLAGTSTATRVTGDAQAVGPANAAMQVVTPATTNAGASFRMYKKFRKGVTYTFTGRLWAPSSVTTAQMALGVTGDAGTTAAVALAPGAAVHLGTWTPTADYDSAVVSARIRAATATTFRLDSVDVYEGTVAPTTGRHAQGAGAPPPFGILHASNAIPSTLVGWAATASGGALGGNMLSLVSGTATSAEWFIDPTLLAADEFTSEITLEVYGRIAVAAAAISASAVLSAVPENNVGQRLYSEWGTAGKSLVIPATGAAAQRLVRLGQITLPVDQANASRWRLKLAITANANTEIDLNYLLIVPGRQRSAGATAHANDVTYPAFFHATAIEELKTIASDLSGRYGVPPGPLGRDSGLSGQLLELPPGDAQAVVKLSSVVPDDPTASAYAEANASSTNTLHFAVQPRYLLSRSS